MKDLLDKWEKELKEFKKVLNGEKAKNDPLIRGHIENLILTKEKSIKRLKKGMKK